MRWYWRKWMIVAEPLDPLSCPHVQMARMWNATYLNTGLNRYFTTNAAEMDAEQHTAAYGLYCRFVIVDRQTWHEGWA